MPDNAGYFDSAKPVFAGSIPARCSINFMPPRWEDFDWQHTTVTIRRSAYRGAIDETKTTFIQGKAASGSHAGEAATGLEGAIAIAVAILQSDYGDAIYFAEPAAALDWSGSRGAWHRGPWLPLRRQSDIGKCNSAKQAYRKQATFLTYTPATTAASLLCRELLPASKLHAKATTGSIPMPHRTDL
jgi:hypothetical protein